MDDEFDATDMSFPHWLFYAVWVLNHIAVIIFLLATMYRGGFI